MTHELICTTCGAALTAPLTVRFCGDPFTFEPECEVGPALTPAGVALRFAAPTASSGDRNGSLPVQCGSQFWLNLQDVETALENVDDGRRLQGCCGRDGQDGPNQRCRTCDAEVGTAMDDCWTNHVFIPEHGMTRWIEVDIE